jgi:nucleoside-diphosphate-sugar epimerase
VILLTGASGYIGSAVYAALKQRDIPVLTAGRSSCDRFLDLNRCEGLSQLLADITVVIHCAGIAHNKGNAAAYQVANVEASGVLATAAVAAGVKQFIFLSSLNVVPASVNDPGTPAALLPKPESLYAQSKWRAETLLSKLVGVSECEFVILRPALVYDRTLTANLALLKKWQRRVPVSLPVTGERSLVARPDLVVLIVSLLLGSESKFTPSGQALAVTDGQSYSAFRIAKALTQTPTLRVPAPLWRFFLFCLAVLPLAPAQAIVASLSGHYWCGSSGAQPFNDASWSLERLLSATEAERAA